MHYERKVLAASTLTGDEVKNPQGEKLGKLEEIMIDLNSGKVAYAVLSFGGIMGIGNKLFALPWDKIKVDQENKCIVVNINKEKLENMPGFDKDNWPDMSNVDWVNKTNDYYQNW